MSIKWTDIAEIAIQLEEHYPKEDNINLRFTDLHKWVIGLDDFDDDPNSSNEKILRRFKWHGYMKGNNEN